MEKDEDELEPAPARPTIALMPVPKLKTGDVDALVNFLNADSVVGAIPPMDAVFAELTDFDLGKKAEQLARKVVEQNISDASELIKVTITIKKKKKVDAPIDPKVMTEADEVV